MLYKEYFLKQDLMTWEEFVPELNKIRDNTDHLRKYKNLGFNIIVAKNFPKMNNIHTTIHNQFANKKFADCQLYVNFKTESESLLGRHKDEQDVYLVVIQGKIFVEVEYIENNAEQFILEQGDMIHIPKEIYHSVQHLTPRIVASIGIFN